MGMLYKRGEIFGGECYCAGLMTGVVGRGGTICITGPSHSAR